MNSLQQSFFSFLDNTLAEAGRALVRDDADYLEMYHQRIQVCESMLISLINNINDESNEYSHIRLTLVNIRNLRLDFENKLTLLRDGTNINNQIVVERVLSGGN